MHFIFVPVSLLSPLTPPCRPTALLPPASRLLGFVAIPACWMALGVVDITLLNACYIVWTVSYLAWALLKPWVPSLTPSIHTSVDPCAVHSASVTLLLVNNAPSHAAIRWVAAHCKAPRIGIRLVSCHLILITVSCARGCAIFTFIQTYFYSIGFFPRCTS